MKYLVSSIYYGLRDLVYSPNRDLVRKGYHVVENLLTDELCDYLLEDIMDRKNNRQISWKDQESSDFRIMGYAHPKEGIFERIDNLVENYFVQYVGSRRSYKFFRMANVVLAKKGNKGSGGGWHRDSLNRRQLKLMIYLRDVDFNNGPFEYIKGSHRLSHKLRYNMFRQGVRFGESSKTVKSKSDILVGKKGTAIIFDSSGVHRGRPLIVGQRYALTYYTFSGAIPDHLMSLIDFQS